MPITKGAKKALRASARKRVYNLRRVRVMRDTLKDLRKAVSAKDAKRTSELMPAVYKAIDKAAKRGVIKGNTAARKKSRAARLAATLAK